MGVVIQSLVGGTELAIPIGATKHCPQYTVHHGPGLAKATFEALEMQGKHRHAKSNRFFQPYRILCGRNIILELHTVFALLEEMCDTFAAV